ncbi:hypothetical protein NDU88_000770 [Pleurodeles waltl]|uniref:Uncharacterized protein n=1 Tax=Pleurodeles waltl TaxID=8319 RepID=A0AAV7V9X1_PLEWA|nr:hypothetical protein NDU88_000770 [Pleurodeles waltl]
MNSGERETKRIRKTPGLVFESLDGGRSQESFGPDTKTRTAGPGEHTSEPATLQEKHGQARDLVRYATGRDEDYGIPRGLAYTEAVGKDMMS